MASHRAVGMVVLLVVAVAAVVVVYLSGVLTRYPEHLDYMLGYAAVVVAVELMDDVDELPHLVEHRFRDWPFEVQGLVLLRLVLLAEVVSCQLVAVASRLRRGPPP